MLFEDLIRILKTARKMAEIRELEQLTRRFSALPAVDVSETRKPIFASRFTGQTGNAGNRSGNFHEYPRISTNFRAYIESFV